MTDRTYETDDPRLDALYLTYAQARAAYLKALRAKFPHQVGDDFEYHPQHDADRVTILLIEALEPSTAGWIDLRGRVRTQRGQLGKTKTTLQALIHNRPIPPYHPRETEHGIEPRNHAGYYSDEGAGIPVPQDEDE